MDQLSSFKDRVVSLLDEALFEKVKFMSETENPVKVISHIKMLPCSSLYEIYFGDRYRFYDMETEDIMMIWDEECKQERVYAKKEIEFYFHT